MRRQRGGPAVRVRSGGCCLCASLALVALATLSPLWLFQMPIEPGKRGIAAGAVLGTSPWAVSTSSLPWRCFEGAIGCFVERGGGSFSDLNDTLCTEPFYSQLGHHGFCKGELNGSMQLPPPIVEARVFIGFAMLLFVVGGLLAICGPTVGGSCAVKAAAIVGFSGCGCVIASVVSAMRFEWYVELRSDNGSVLPFATSVDSCSGGPCLVLEPAQSMKLGIGFWAMCGAALVSLLTATCLCALSRHTFAPDETLPPAEEFDWSKEYCRSSESTVCSEYDCEKEASERSPMLPKEQSKWF